MFAVSGIIELRSPLVISNGRVTIAGQTAPGAGVTLKNFGLRVAADEVIVRFIRSRPGDGAGFGTDAISVSSGRNVIIDHCSASWSTDETLSVSPADDSAFRPLDAVSVQWSIISESLNRSVHAKGAHGYGSLIRGNGGGRYSFHHNLWAHHLARMPRPGNYVSAQYDPVGPVMDFRNNVFYNWGRRYSGYNADTDSLARYNFVNNAYIPGPDSTGTVAFAESNPLAVMHFSGNYMAGKPVTDPLEVLELPEGSALAPAPLPSGQIRTEPVPDALARVLEFSGASLRRDTVDSRIVAEVTSGGGRIIDDESEVGGWPVHSPTPAPRDQDADGMPDTWERERGLDPADPSDGASDRDGDGYTNLEDYLNGLVTQIMTAG